MHRGRRPANAAGRFVVERKASQRRATPRNSRRGNAAIGGAAPRIVDAISDAVQ
jgi:hypothetical protein